jgi:B-box zinc finger
MDSTTLYCQFHPNRTTTLRCNRCGQPICTECAILTPVGYRCKACVRQQQKVFETALGLDFLKAFFLSAICCFVGALVSSFIGFFVVFEAVFIGALAARIIQWAIRYRRSRYMWLIATFGGVAGCLAVLLPMALVLLITALSSGSYAWLGLAMTLLWPVLYMVISVSTLAGMIKGIRL